jgi:hypothetical protein
VVVVRVAAVALLAACSPSTPHHDFPDAAPPDEMVTAPSTGIERFVGKLATSQTDPFGGSPYCNYTMTLKNIVVDATMHPDDGLVTMLVTNTTKEAVVGSCPYGPSPDGKQAFDHKAGPVLPDTQDAYIPVLAGAAVNNPKADVTATLWNDKAQLLANVHWHRTDQGPPLDWKIDTLTPIVLDRVACEAGDVYCLGGSTQGGEYGCVDGFKFELLKRCTNGCAPSTQLPPAPHEDEACK